MKQFLLLLLAISISGCSTVMTASGEQKLGEDLSAHGTLPTTDDVLEIVDLALLLDPDVRPLKKKSASQSSEDNKENHYERLESQRIARAFAKFHTDYALDPEREQLRRNQIQETMLAASERRCGRFIKYIRSGWAKTNFGLGLATTISAGLGALVPGLRDAQALSGIAAILSGTRAEYNQTYYSNLTVALIAKAIERKREDAYVKLRESQRAPSRDYSIEAAVKDAVTYDGLCNIVVGLEQANESLFRKEPGLDALKESLVKLQVMGHIAKGDYAKLKADAENLKAAEVHLRSISPASPTPVSTYSSPTGTGEMEPAQVFMQQKQVLLKGLEKLEADLREAIPLEVDETVKTQWLASLKAQIGATDTGAWVSAFDSQAKICLTTKGWPSWEMWSTTNKELKLKSEKKELTDKEQIELQTLAAVRSERWASVLKHAALQSELRNDAQTVAREVYGKSMVDAVSKTKANGKLPEIKSPNWPSSNSQLCKS